MSTAPLRPSPVREAVIKTGFILESDRERIFHALLGDVTAFAPGDLARACLEEVATRDLEAIEPIIESIVRRNVETCEVKR